MGQTSPRSSLSLEHPYAYCGLVGNKGTHELESQKLKGGFVGIVMGLLL